MAIKPCGFRVIVLPDPVESDLKKEGNEYKSKGGILVASESEAVKDALRERASQTFGTIVHIGDTAWKAYDKGPDWKPWAKVGDRVAYARHGGSFITDPDDDVEYMLLNDNDITAIITEEV